MDDETVLKITLYLIKNYTKLHFNANLFLSSWIQIDLLVTHKFASRKKPFLDIIPYEHEK